jgi:3-isopropylmalate/(R)-2-methylmalate dehydratase small subunit
VKPYLPFESRLVPLPKNNIDTDQIIPARFLKTTSKEGLDKNLFCDWRQDPNFILNTPRGQNAQILLAGDNFGCGSSREHAAWSLVDRGFRAVVAPSFARIFFENAYNNGIAPIVVPSDEIDALLRSPNLRIDLDAETIVRDDGGRVHFTLDPLRKQFLLSGGYMAFLASKVAAVRAWDAARAVPT